MSHSVFETKVYIELQRPKIIIPDDFEERNQRFFLPSCDRFSIFNISWSFSDIHSRQRSTLIGQLYFSIDANIVKIRFPFRNFTFLICALLKNFGSQKIFWNCNMEVFVLKILNLFCNERENWKKERLWRCIINKKILDCVMMWSWVICYSNCDCRYLFPCGDSMVYLSF